MGGGWISFGASLPPTLAVRCPLSVSHQPAFRQRRPEHKKPREVIPSTMFAVQSERERSGPAILRADTICANLYPCIV